MTATATASLVNYANNNLTDRDALAVQIVANRNGVTAREVGDACGRGSSWFGGRLATINAKLCNIELEIGVRVGSHGYEIRELAPEVEALPPEAATITIAAGSLAPGNARTIVEQAREAPPAPQKIHAHFVTVNGRLFDLRRMLTACPEENRQRVAVSMQWGTFVHIPAPGNNGEARALADKIIALKQAEDGVIVSDLNEGTGR